MNIKGFKAKDGTVYQYDYDSLANKPAIPEGPGSGGNVDYVGIEPAYDDIPKVFFGGALQQTKDEAVVPFRYISKTDDFIGWAEIKAQGNSSMSYPKKNQTVKLFKDEACDSKMKVDFKGWGKQNKHVYKANWIDLSHARNVVSARLWADVVKSRANYADLPELLRTTPNQGAIDGFPVKVYAAGVYQGRYTLNIPKDKWTFNMDDKLDEHCVLCGENYVSGCFRAAAQINESDWTDEIHDTVPASIKTRWNQVISFVMNSTDDEFRANLSQYFYVDSLIDYYLFGLASCGLDAFGKNQIYATYDGQRWIASMYDMDSTWGLYWNGSKFVATDYARTSYEDYVHTSGNLLYNRLEQLFSAELQTRWAELKNGALSITNIINRFERFTDIAPAELVAEDYASTTGGGKFTGIPSKTTNNIQQIRAFALARQAWTDEYVAGLTPAIPVPCEGISLDKSNVVFTGQWTEDVTATVIPDGCTDNVIWVSSNPEIATISVSGYVCTVEAIANGNATITVTCGEYSASCTVAVSGIAEPVPCTGITLDKTELTFTEEGSQTLVATVTPTDTTDKIVWSSDNVSVARVENGVVTAVQNGSATITATCGNQVASCTVTVNIVEENIFDGVVWTKGTNVQANGTEGTSASDACTNYIDVSAFAGKRIANNYEQPFSRFVFYDESKVVISSVDTSVGTAIIPTNAKYMRVSVYKKQSAVELLVYTVGENLSDGISEEDGAYNTNGYDANDTGSKHINMPVSVGEKYLVCRFWGVALLDESGAMVRFTRVGNGASFEVNDNEKTVALSFSAGNRSTKFITDNYKVIGRTTTPV